MTAHIATAKPKLPDEVRSALRLRHCSPRTEEAYIHWIKQFIFFHDIKNSREFKDELLFFLIFYILIK